MPIVVDSETRIEQGYVRRDAEGREITERTLEKFRARENGQPGTLSSAVAFFRPLRQDTRLQSLGRNQSNRLTLHARAFHHARQSQRDVMAWLWDRHGPAGKCFAGCCDFSFNPDRHCHFLPVTNALVLPATSALVEELRAFEEILAVEENYWIRSTVNEKRAPLEVVRLLGSGGSPAYHRNGYTWGWDRLGLREIHRAGFTGRGIRLAIANSGVHDRHADLVFKVKDFAKVQYPATVQPAHSFDNDGHGTHCAGIMVGTSNSGVQIGGAPDAELVAVSVLDGNQGLLSALLAGLEWLTDPYRAVNVINISLGIKDITAASLTLLEHAVDQLEQMNILCVGAIGNDPNASYYPARLGNVLGCGAFDSKQNVWDDSGEGPDLVLPGESIYSCLPPGHPGLDGQDYGWYTGTSQAAAHLSALAGLLMQAEPLAGPRLIVEGLLKTASHANQLDSRRGCGIPSFMAAREYIRGQLVS